MRLSRWTLVLLLCTASSSSAQAPLPRFVRLEPLENSASRIQRLPLDEAERFVGSGRQFQAVLDQRLRRSLRERRRSRMSHFDRQLQAEEASLNRTRQEAIALFERFLRAHPLHPELTPGAMIRLAELYYERDFERAIRDGSEVDCGSSMELYGRLIERFPTDRHVPTARHFLAICELEKGQPDEARAQWQSVACFSDERCASSPELRATAAFRLGELDFEVGDEASLRASIVAYQSVPVDHRLRPLALYKLAWAHYRLDEVEVALQHFQDVLDESSGLSSLADEALTYLALIVSESDQAGSSESGVARMQNPGEVRQDRAWTPDAYRRLGEVYEEEGRALEAIRIWRAALARFGQVEGREELLRQIARLEAQRGDEEASIAALEELAAGPSQSDALAQARLVVARERHRAAQLERARCGECARPHYERASRAYQLFLERHPLRPEVALVHLSLGDIELFVGDASLAAEHFRVARSGLGGEPRVDAARRVVAALEKRLAELELQVADSPELVDSTPVPRRVPGPLDDLAVARERYLQLGAAADDREQLRLPFAYNNAAILYAYGFWERAHSRLLSVYADACLSNAEVATLAWSTMIAMADARSDDAALASLVSSARGCAIDGEMVSETGRELQARRAQRAFDAATTAQARATAAFAWMASSPDDPRARRAAVAALSELEDPAGALALVRPLVDEGDAHAAFTAGLLAHRLFELELSADMFERAAAGPPQLRRDALINLAQLARWRGDVEAEAEALGRLLALGNSAPTDQLALAHAELRRGRVSVARRQLHQLVQSASVGTRASLLLASTHRGATQDMLTTQAVGHISTPSDWEQAEAMLALATRPITLGRPRRPLDISQMWADLRRELEKLRSKTDSRHALVDRVISAGNLEWSVAALLARSEMYLGALELIESHSATYPLPRQLPAIPRQLRGVPNLPSMSDLLRERVGTLVREAAQPLVCAAAKDAELALRAARQGQLDPRPAEAILRRFASDTLEACLDSSALELNTPPLGLTLVGTRAPTLAQ